MENEDRTLQLTLQLVADKDKKDLDWALEMFKLHHYMKRVPHPKSDLLVYIIRRVKDGARVGCILYNRMQCSRVRGWFGSLEEVNAGACPYTQWEMINLARVWLSPMIQRPYPVDEDAAQAVPCGPVPQFLFAPEEPMPEYVHHAASQVILESLDRVAVDYLKRFPPPFPGEPWRLRQCVSYCDTKLFNCAIYQASRFRAVRENKQGIRTYVHGLRDLLPHEVDEIMEASRTNARCRRRRAARKFADTMRQPAILSGKLPLQTEPGAREVSELAA